MNCNRTFDQELNLAAIVWHGATGLVNKQVVVRLLEATSFPFVCIATASVGPAKPLPATMLNSNKPWLLRVRGSRGSCSKPFRSAKRIYESGKDNVEQDREKPEDKVIALALWRAKKVSEEGKRERERAFD